MNLISEKMKKYLEEELISLAKQALKDKQKKGLVSSVLVTNTVPDSTMQREIEKKLIGLLSGVLKLPEDKIDVQDNVAHYGMDSLVITEFIKRVSDLFGIQLQATIFFEARNLKRLSELICERYHPEVDVVPEETATKKESPTKIIKSESTDKERILLEKYRTIFSSDKTKSQKNVTKQIDDNKRIELDANIQYEPIAIIGVDGMFAKSKSPDELWENLKNEKDCIEEIPKDRWNWEDVFGDPLKEDKTNVKWGGFIPDIDQFDASFFNIPPKEAELMDPQHRLFIQSVWKAIYRAGYSTKALSEKKIGLFLGVNLQDYQLKLQKQPLDAMNLIAAHHVFCPSRISFLLNITGPCHVIDTACSSSLVAIHRAILAIQNEGCEMAIAGGVNLMMDPMMHIQYAKTGMICKDGRCKSFSDEANGYVRGDGVGAIVLKKLSAAERDRDNIIGVIKGSAENHGGTSASLTAPNPNAQANLIKEAILKSGIDPRTIGYIEAHGTGTALGDPIEINGIKKAFNELFEEKGIVNPPYNYCKIGSVKSNIGHAETAAGLAGLLKVLYGMKNKFIPKSLHTQEINQFIQLNQSPFSIAQKGSYWENIELNGVTFPRVAGISSFGAGGANAHIIVEAYEKKAVFNASTEEIIIPISAKSKESLTKNIKALLKYISISSEDKQKSLAYYLKNELVDWLSNYLNIAKEEIEIDSNYQDLNIQRYDLTALLVFLAEKWDLSQLEQSIETGNTLSQLITNLSVQFKTELERYYRISTFEASENAVRKDLNLADIGYTLQIGRDAFNFRLAFIANSVLDLKLQFEKYLNDELNDSNYFSGNTKQEKINFLLEGHAGKAYIESAIKFNELKALAQLWTKGIDFDWNLLNNGEVRRIELPPYQFNEKRFWIESIHQVSDTERALLTPLLHQNTSDFKTQKFTSIYTGSEEFLIDHQVQGIKTLPGVAYLELARSGGCLALDKVITGISDIVWLRPIQVTDKAVEITTSYLLDEHGAKFEISSITNGTKQIHSQGKLSTGSISAGIKHDLSEIRQQFGKKIMREECYAEFNQRGLNYGVGFQGIQEMYYSHTEALSRISLNSNSAYTLAPGVLDSALQSCMGIDFKTNNQALELPFSIKELNILGSLPDYLWCYVRLSNSESKLKEYNLDLCDDDGNVLVQIKGFVAISISGGTLNKNEASVNYYTSEWKAVEKTESKTIISEKDQLVILDSTTEFCEQISKAENWKVEHLETTDPQSLFTYFKEKIVTAIKEKALLNLTIVGAFSNYSNYGFIRGLIKTAEQEYPQFQGRLVALEKETMSDLDLFLNRLTSEVNSSEKEIKYSSANRFVRSITSIEPNATQTNALELKPNGVYLITGGFGGLGLEFAHHIATKCGAIIILSGRSKLTTEKQNLLKTIPNAFYLSADVTKATEVARLMNKIKTDHGQLKGILHGAGVLRDSFLIHKTDEDITAVFAPKIEGIKNLDEATKNEDLDFIFCFSSVSSILGNIGQSDYASANAFMDDFVSYRNALLNKGERRGLTLSINWPLWRSGGMQIDASSEQYLKRHWGMQPLPTVEGLNAFDLLLQSAYNSWGVLFGDSTELNKKFFSLNNKGSKKEKVTSTVVKEDLISEVEEEILLIAANVLKLDVAEMEVDVELGDFGFDSISLTQFSNALNDVYNLNLVPTLFYNYPTIQELSSFLLDENIEVFLKNRIDTDKENIKNEQFESNPVDNVNELNSLENVIDNRFFKQHNISEIKKQIQTVQEENEVAIVGITGRLPGANNLDEYWENLITKKDAITEIPKDRWDWKAYYGDPYKEKNKTKAKHGGFIEDIDKFDALFFNISPHEAQLMDPQQRITLEQVYHLFENAGIKSDSVKGSDTGVFIGVSSTDYSTLLKKDADVVDEAHFSTGYSHAVLANRISYLFDLHGPSEPIDTACSSSLVAIHRAVENIKSGNCTMAIAGGVNAILSPDLTLSFSQAGMLSEDGRCMSFDERANGYVRAEGIGLVLLKSLKKAKEDGDYIYGLIKGSNENHGGKANTLTSPNSKAQKALLVKAYTKAGISPLDVSYIEAHGTGTPLGDPIETEALKLAFKEIAKEQDIELPNNAFCKLGSVKANIGHLESAAGIAGVLKVILGIKNGALPGNPHLKNPNEYLKLTNSPFELMQNTEEWISKDNKPRIAGVSSFGFGGANAHVIIQEYLNNQHVKAYEGPVLICFSAKTKEGLENQKKNYLKFILQNESLNLYGLAYTLHIGRDEFNYRWATKVKTIQELVERITQDLEGKDTVVFEGRISKTTNKPSNEKLNEFLNRNELEELAKLWINGIEIDWKQLYLDKKYSKIQLPNYPFEKKRYWIPEEREDNVNTHVNSFEMIERPQKKLHPLLHNYK